MMKKYVAFLSQLYHFLAYSIKKPKNQFEKGMLIISIDVDVGSRELGVINRGKNDSNVSRHISEYQVGVIEELALPLFLETFNDFVIPVTFAIRGQLTDVNDSVLELLLKSPVKHDIGAHGYYHMRFQDLSQNQAENELKMISVGMKKFDVIPKSFVFPRNSVAHLELLEKYGYKCYRSHGNFMNDCMSIERRGKLYDVHPSIHIDQDSSILLLKKLIDIAITKRLPFHMWCHLWTFGRKKRSLRTNINKVVAPLLEYAKKKEKSSLISFETMLSASEKVEKLSAAL